MIFGFAISKDRPLCFDRIIMNPGQIMEDGPAKQVLSIRRSLH